MGLQKVALFCTLKKLNLYKEVETQTYVWFKNPYHYRIIKCLDILGQFLPKIRVIQQFKSNLQVFKNFRLFWDTLYKAREKCYNILRVNVTHRIKVPRQWRMMRVKTILTITDNSTTARVVEFTQKYQFLVSIVICNCQEKNSLLIGEFSFGHLIAELIACVKFLSKLVPITFSMIL